MMKRRVRFVLLSFVAVLGQVVLGSAADATLAEAATIMHETFKGDAVITRNVTAPKPGAYLLILKNGTAGPHDIEQCDVEDSDEEKTECLSRNLSENVDQDFSRAKEAEIKINGRRLQGITNARSFLIVPVTLKGGTNKIDILLRGRSSSRLTVSLEPAPQAAFPPEAAFLLSRLSNTVRTPFTFDAKESFSPNGNSLRYSWNFGDGAIESGKSRVSHSFSKPGTYSVQLTVTDQTTRLSSNFSVDVTVLNIDKTKPPKNQKPKPVIQYALDTVNPLHVTFDGTQSTDDGTIVSYSWKIFQEVDHNNRHDHRITAERTGAQFDYVFPRTGSYTVRLTVKDNQGAEAATERVVSTSDMSGLVRDESLFGPKKYSAAKKVIESFALESPRLAVLKINNADALEHPIESCARMPWPEKLGCLFQNSVNRAYIALYRVSEAEVFINGQRVTDRIDKHKAYYETVVSLQTSNTIEIRTKGWPSAFIELELQSLEVNEAPIVYVTHSEPRRGIPQLIEFDASTSVDMNDHIMSYRFQALNAAGAVAIDTDWQGAGYAALEFTERGTFTVVVSARDTFGAVGTKSVPITIESNQIPLVTASYVVLSNQAPYQVRVTALASDPDGDALQYNFAYSTGQVSGFQDSPQGLTSFAAAGTYSVAVTARDINGGTATFTLPITFGGNLLPIANFDFVTDRGGYAPLTITVDASPSSDPDDATETLRYFWTFGDNSPRVEGKILSHTFINQGQYTVTLSVLDPKRGLSTKSRAAFAWRTTPPNPVLIANPRVGPASLTVDFDASQSTPGASPIASYLFDYADGTFDRSLTPFKTHTFTQPGIYNVGLIVYDTDGNGNIGGQTIYVFDGKKPSAAIQVVSSDVITPARFELQGSGVSPNPLGTITDYKWTLPNGIVQTGASLIYTTSTNGNFNIQLQVKDSYGYWSDPATIDLSAASGTLPIAQITADKTRIALGQAVKLSGLNSYTSNGQANLVNYEWTLPNGTKIYGPEKTVTLSATGLKTISLIVTDSKGYVSSPATIQIQVDARQTPVPAISMTTSGTVVPVTASLNGLQSTTPNPGALITGYEWKIEAPDSVPPINFSLFGAEVSAQLVVPYTHTISLRVFDSAGAVSGWISRTFGPLINNPPIAVVTPSAVIAKAPATVILSAIESTDPDGHNIINAHWLFSDGTDFQGLIATHEFSNTGTYSATVRVQDQYGAWSDPVTVPITLNANLPPVALMTSVSDANNKFNFTFDASTSFDLDGTIARYDWFFSDGFISLGAGPTITHAFPAAGTWRAGVNVFDNNGAMATVQVEVTIEPGLPPIAKIEVVEWPSSSSNLAVKFSANQSTSDSPIISYIWSFGDGTTALGSEVTHVYARSEIFPVTLKIMNTSGIQSTDVISVNVQDYSDRPPTAIINGKINEEYVQEQTSPAEIVLNTIPQVVHLRGTESDSSPTTNQKLKHYWNVQGIGTYEGEGLDIVINKAGAFNVELRSVDIQGRESIALSKITAPIETCFHHEGDNTCPTVSTGSANVIGLSSSATIETNQAGMLSTDSLDNGQVVTVYDSNYESIDATPITSFNGSAVHIDRNQLVAATSTLTPPFEIVIQAQVTDPELPSVQGTVKNVYFAKLNLNILLPIGSHDIALFGGIAGQSFFAYESTGTFTANDLTSGTYNLTYSVGTESFARVITIDDTTNPTLDLRQALAATSMSKVSATSNKQTQLASSSTPSFPMPVPLDAEQRRLHLRSDVADPSSLKSSMTSMSQAISMANPVPANYFAWCGTVPTQFPIISEGPTKLPEEYTWGRFTSNNINTIPDPTTEEWGPLSKTALSEKKIKAFCMLQSPTYMESDYWKWLLQANLSCCQKNGGNNDCLNQQYQTDSTLRVETPLETSPINYDVQFRDGDDNSTLVTQRHSFTFAGVANKLYAKSSMTRTFGLPLNNNVDGWAVPYSFSFKVPAALKKPQFRVKVSSAYKNANYSHAYYCWAESGPADAAFDLKVIKPTGTTPGKINAENSFTGQRLFPVSRDARDTLNLFSSALSNWEFSPDFEIKASGNFNTADLGNLNAASINVRVEAEVPGLQTVAISNPASVSQIQCAGSTCTGSLRFNAADALSSILPLENGILPGEARPTSAVLIYRMSFQNGGKQTNTTKFRQVVKLNYDMAPDKLYSAEQTESPSYRCPWGYGTAWSTYGRGHMVNFVEKVLLPIHQNTSLILLCNDLSLPFGGTFPPHEAHRNGQNLDIAPFSTDPEFANTFHANRAPDDPEQLLPDLNRAFRKKAAYSLLRLYAIATTNWPCQTVGSPACSTKFTGEECWKRIDDNSYPFAGKCPAVTIPQMILPYYSSTTPAINDLVRFAKEQRLGLWELISIGPTSAVSGFEIVAIKKSLYKILMSNGMKSVVSDGSQVPAKAKWIKTLLFDGMIEVTTTTSRKLPIYRNGALAIQSSCPVTPSISPSSWKTPGCEEIISGKKTFSYDTTRVIFQDEDQHMNHIHLEVSE